MTPARPQWSIPRIEEILMIFPDFCFSMYLAAAWAHRKTPIRLIRNVLSHSSAVLVIKGVEMEIPALLTRTSIRPNSWTKESRACSIESFWATSPGKPFTASPRSFACRTTSAKFFSERSRIPTLAPSPAKRRAVAAPIPLPPPVINTALSVNLINILPDMYSYISLILLLSQVFDDDLFDDPQMLQDFPSG